MSTFRASWGYRVVDASESKRAEIANDVQQDVTPFMASRIVDQRLPCSTYRVGIRIGTHSLNFLSPLESDPPSWAQCEHLDAQDDSKTSRIGSRPDD